MGRRTLVIILGQLRAHQLTWKNFEQNVLSQLEADLAVCVPDDAFFDCTNPFYANARFRWPVPDAPDLSSTFDQIQKQLGSSEDWRVLCDVKGSWLGRISASGQKGAAAILYILRWFMLHNIRAEALCKVYDRFVITRSDFYYVCPHPPLDCLTADRLWLPDGEDYGGLCDRHLVVSAGHLIASCNLIDDLLLYPRQMRDAMIENTTWNIEQLLAFHLSRNGLISKIERFPYIMFLVREPEDPTAWSTGDYVPDVNMVVKYPSELYEAERFRSLIQSSDDWRSYFASRRNSEFLPARIYTSHGTVLYVDEDTGELRHGPLRESPDNVFLVGDTFAGRIVYRLNNLGHGTVGPLDRTSSSLDHSTSAIPSSTVCEVERIPTTHKVIRGGAGCLISLKTGAYQLSAEPDGRLVLDRPHFNEWQQLRVVPDFRQKPASPQNMPYVAMARRRHRLIAQSEAPVFPEAKSGGRKLTLSVAENRLSGWYRLKIVSPNDLLRQNGAEGNSLSARFYRFQNISHQRHYAGYLFISSNLFITSKLEVIEFLFGLSSSQMDALIVNLRWITPLEYIWHSIQRGFFRQARRFLQYYFRPTAPILLRPDFPCPPLQ